MVHAFLFNTSRYEDLPQQPGGPDPWMHSDAGIKPVQIGAENQAQGLPACPRLYYLAQAIERPLWGGLRPGLAAGPALCWAGPSGRPSAAAKIKLRLDSRPKASSHAGPSPAEEPCSSTGSIQCSLPWLQSLKMLSSSRGQNLVELGRSGGIAALTLLEPCLIDQVCMLAPGLCVHFLSGSPEYSQPSLLGA